MNDARTNVRVFAIIAVGEDRAGDPETFVSVRKIVYTREAAEAALAKLNAAGDGKRYFSQLASLEPLS